ncbi:type II toxin-antitoxin system RelE/ParE family toxin [Nostoc sp.]|uniref:type II toxin-antitoxin system RelE/ParE family toxin n=1 Tax=Nostoc sp. TaxID=1180 RepID=UPI002FF9F857
MSWVVEFHEDFEPEFDDLPEEVKDGLFTLIELLKEYGSQLKRPHVDTLKGSKYANMKEMRFNAADGVWRVAFAFDTSRCAILLVAGDKSGTSQKRFYKQLIKKADARFGKH